MQRLRRRLVVATVGSLAFGLVASVAVAWVLCLWPIRSVSNVTLLYSDSEQGGDPSSNALYMSWSSESVGFRHATIWQGQADAPINRHATIRMRANLLAQRAGSPIDPAHPAYDVDPEWPAWLPLPPEDGTDYAMWSARAAGWPMACLASYGTQSEPAGAQHASWSMRIWPATTTNYASPRDPDQGAVPLRPLPLGLAVNTLVFATPLFIVLVGVPLVRSGFRRHRGRCESCGYAIGDLERCPECGRARRAIGRK